MLYRQLQKRIIVGMCIGGVCVLSSCQSRDDSSFPFTQLLGNEVIIQTDVSERFTQHAVDRFAVVYDAYKRLIPLASKRTRPFTITVFKDKNDFLRYERRIGPTQSEVGFYIPERGELVLHFKGSNQTLKTLYHEAFHAYFEDRIIHPPAWLNEGFAQYVETLRFGFGNAVSIGKRHDGLISVLRTMGKQGSIPHLRDIVERDWPQRHALTREQYAASWGMVYFFKKSSKQRKREFTTYLTLLYQKENPVSAFYKIWPDIEALNTEWRTFIKSMVRKKMLLDLIPGL